MSFVLGFILRPTVIKKNFPLPYIICHVLPCKCSTRSTRRTGCSSTLYIRHFQLSLYSETITSPTFKSSVPLESSSSLELLWSEAVSSSKKLYSILSSNKHFLLDAITATECSFERNQDTKSAMKKQTVCWYMRVMSYTISKLQTSATWW